MGDQVVGGDQDPPLLVPEDRVGGAVAGPVQHLERAVAEGEHARRRRAAASPRPCEPQPRKLRETLCRATTTSSGMPLRSISSTANWSSRSASSPKLASRSAATSIAATSAPECSTMISTRPRWSMCWWVRITSSRSSIEWPRSPSWRLQLVQRLARVGPGVDQGQRLVLEQVAVDPPDRERRRDAQAVDAGLRAPAPAPRSRGQGHARISARTSSRFASMSSRETSDSRLRRSSGSVLEGRTLKCQSG